MINCEKSFKGLKDMPLEEDVVPGSGHLSGTVFEEHRALFQSLGGLLQQHTDLWCLLLSQIPALPLHPPASIARDISGKVLLLSLRHVYLGYMIKFHAIILTRKFGSIVIDG